ncbi:MAG: DUF1273 domain-containing protein [Oscillospiraceae bacterium]|nr:DUF1273 domain-containing protein [Oscillospiraceae bacterium]
MADFIREKSCCFTGHRPDKLPWRTNELDWRCQVLKGWMAQTVEQAWLDGYRHFICGMALGCDLYFCEAVLDFQVNHPEVRLEAAIPFPGQAERWPPAQQRRWKSLVNQCSFQTVIQPAYDRGCMLRRDRYMVSRSSRIIAVYNGTPGGTMQTLAYAMQNRLEIIRLDPDEL